MHSKNLDLICKWKNGTRKQTCPRAFPVCCEIVKAANWALLL